MTEVCIPTEEALTTNLRQYGEYREATWDEPSMTNCDHSIDDGMEEFLRASLVVSTHAAWDFHGRVWWQGDAFHEQVSVYHMPIAQYRAATLRDLMEIVNNAHGWD